MKNNKRRAVVVSMVGAPGSGKTNLAMGLAAHISNNFTCHVEYVRDVVAPYAIRGETMPDQLEIYCAQRRMLFNLINDVDVIITDASILNSLVYGIPEGEVLQSRGLSSLVMEDYETIKNINIFCCPPSEENYRPEGREQGYDEMLLINDKFRNLVLDPSIDGGPILWDGEGEWGRHPIPSLIPYIVARMRNFGLSALRK